MKNTDQIASAYKYVFKFPSMKTILLYITLATIPHVALLHTIPPRKIVAQLLMLTGLPISLRLASPEVITTRRALGLLPLVQILLSLANFAHLLLKTNPLAPAPLIIALYSTTIRGIGTRNTGQLALWGTTLGTALLTDLLTGVLIILSAAIPQVLLLKTDPYWTMVFKAFVKYLLTGDQRDYETLIIAKAQHTKTPVYVLELKTDAGSCRMYLPQLHYGPFRTLGSSILPARLSKATVERGKCPLTVHRASGHELNLASSHDVDKIVSTLTTTPLTRHYHSLRVGYGEHEDVRTLVMELENEVRIVFAERMGGGMEDPDPSLEEALTKSLGITTILVDLHNSLDPEGNNPHPSPENRLGKNIISAAQKAELRRVVKIGFLHRDLDKDLERGLGSGGVGSLVLEDEKGCKYTLFMIDANNMLADTKLSLLRRLEWGKTLVFIGTTDTHEVAGPRPGLNYAPLGMGVNEDTLLKILKNTTPPSMSSNYEVAGTQLEISTFVYGKRLLEEMARNMTLGVKLFKLAIVSGVVLTLVLLLTLV